MCPRGLNHKTGFIYRHLAYQRGKSHGLVDLISGCYKHASGVSVRWWWEIGSLMSARVLVDCGLNSGCIVRSTHVVEGMYYSVDSTPLLAVYSDWR